MKVQRVDALMKQVAMGLPKQPVPTRQSQKQKQQEAERQPPQHPPVFLVWPAVLAPLPENGQESQVVALVTASSHESDSGKPMTATSHSDLPGGQGNVFADNVIGSGQKTATGHAESGHGETGIDPRIETGLNRQAGRLSDLGTPGRQLQIIIIK